MTFQLTFLESNVHEIAEIVRLAASLGIDRVKGHHLWAHFSQIKELSMRRSRESIARWNAAVRDAQQAANETGVLLENIEELGNGAVSDIDPNATCPFLGREAWISAEGRFSPCCAPDAARRALGDFGTLHDRSLAEIWSSDQYHALQQSYLKNDLCRSCNMRRREEEA